MTHFSASQISTFRDCQRKWAFSHIDGLQGPPNRFAEAGQRLHKLLEAYLKDGVLPTDEKDLQTILPGLPYLPAPGEAITEKFFELETEAGRFVGFVDAQVPGDTPLIIDHKTTSDLKWAMAPEDLLVDPQGVIYAVYAMHTYESDSARLRWVYYQRNNPKSKQVELLVTYEEIEDAWAEIMSDAHAMKSLRDSGRKAKDIEPNVMACDKYGGCPFVTQCNLSASERLKGMRNQMNVIEELKARAAAQKAARAPQGTAEAEAAAPQAINPPSAAAPPASRPMPEPVVEAPVRAAPVVPAQAKIVASSGSLDALIDAMRAAGVSEVTIRL